MFEFIILFWGTVALNALTVLFRPWVRKRATTLPGIEKVPPDPKDKVRGLAILVTAISAMILTEKYAPRMGIEIPGVAVFVLSSIGAFVGFVKDHQLRVKRDKLVSVPSQIAFNRELVEAYYRNRATQIEKIDTARRRYAIMALSSIWLGVLFVGLVVIPDLTLIPIGWSIAITTLIGVVIAIHFADEV